MTDVTIKKVKKVRSLVAQGHSLKDAAKKVNIGLGHYYRSRKKMNAINPDSTSTLFSVPVPPPQVIKISFMGMEVFGEPAIVKEFMIKFMKEYRLS